jgi:LacI family repressor for deo operon, udp, cdd, tsx, nupC, and nupG
MSTTIKDIARQAGVSHTTVSRALHNSPLISEGTTHRIQRIAAELDYHPSVAARSLKTNRSQALGVIVSHIADPFFSEILQGIDDVAQVNGYSLFIASSQQDQEREKAIIQTMHEHRVDGVILCSPRFPLDQIDPLQAFNIPVVAINNQSDEDYPFTIYHDDVDGARQICEHLISLGHRRIGYLGDSTSGRTTKERLAGFEQAMGSAGLSIQPEYTCLMPGNGADQGFDAVKYFAALEQPPTALICYNDMMAVGVLKGCFEAGLDVPSELSVTGFDNITIAEYTHPPLTTIDQPKRFLGSEAARLLLNLLNGPEQATSRGTQVQRLKGSLLVRQSTAVPPGE